MRIEATISAMPSDEAAFSVLALPDVLTCILAMSFLNCSNRSSEEFVSWVMVIPFRRGRPMKVLQRVRQERRYA